MSKIPLLSVALSLLYPCSTRNLYNSVTGSVARRSTMAIIERERGLEHDHEHEHEKHSLRHCLEQVGHPGAQTLAVTGSSQSGKTTLLRAIAAEHDDWLVLWASCLPLGSQIPFGIIHQWFAGLARVSTEGDVPFDGPGAVIRGLVLRGAGDADAASISYALRWVVARLAERQRVLLIVDDLQWADAESATAIGHGVALFSPEPVALLCGIRDRGIRGELTEPRTPVVVAILHVATVVSLRGSSLTPAELRVAALAATGLTNRDIAARLYITQKTVEFHLSRSFRKLAVNNRLELTEALAGAKASVALM